MQYKADSPEDYISQVPEERQAAFKKLRKTILENYRINFIKSLFTLNLIRTKFKLYRKAKSLLK